MSNNNLTDERLSALIRVARDSLELYEMELPVIDDVMLALAELQQRRAAMLQGTEKAKLPTTIQTAPALDSLQKNDEAPTTIKPVADLYEVTVPSGRSTTFTKDAAEAKDCADMGWKVQEYVTLERYQAAMLQGAEPVSQPYTLRDGWVAVPVEPTAEMVAAAMLSNDVLFDQDDDTMFRVQHGVIWRAMLAAAPDFREISNSSTEHFRENAETSTKCPKCGERGSYHCPQMLGTVECECTVTAAPQQEADNG
ncbi:hypothetical protein [Enterobacter sp.]|uniref:hypothetical protein n=1 Tax=Enterobacter sp. TaxID=42895 RepID=UPI002904799A|nr:hypothetical protein [Enterobacter sp.]MDU1921219.1 hypothetical protein [Enterobacter sp.]